MIPAVQRFFRKETVPLLIISETISQEKAYTLLRKLQKINYSHARAIGVVVQIGSHMPVQIDKISEFLQDLRLKHNIKTYGFCHSRVTAESYYLLSAADQVYTMPSTVFQLQAGASRFSSEQLLSRLHIRKNTVKSDEDLCGVNLDYFTSANTSKYLNQKFTEINSRLCAQAIANRVRSHGSLQLDPSPEIMTGEQAVERGYADGLGSYYEVLKTMYPSCELKHVRLKQKMATHTLEALIASPVIIFLFLIKVLIKYTIIMYLWVKHKGQRSK